MIVVETSGTFSRTESWLGKMSNLTIERELAKYGEMGVRALSSATPVDSGETARSWGYKISRTGRAWTLAWTNTNTANGVPIAILLQYGHGTGTGGYVQGRDYINPAIKPVMDRIAAEVWRTVTK